MSLSRTAALSQKATTKMVQRDRERPRKPGKKRYFPRRKHCSFCADKGQVIDYKDVAKLRRFLSDRGKIEPRRKTGVCAGHQRILCVALKRARHIALLPFTGEHLRQMSGPVRE